MILVIDNHKFQYEMEKLCRLFYPYEKIKSVSADEDFEDKKVVVTSVMDGKVTVKAFIDGKTFEKSEDDNTPDAEMHMAKILLDVMENITGYRPGWGVLTGIRPSKLMMQEIEKNSRDVAIKSFCEKYGATEQKAILAADVAEKERKIISLARPESFNLYISIPFCPSRCNYCSFVSHSIERTKVLIEPYVENLCVEIAETGRLAKELGLRLDTVYFGGGTPTTLNPAQLDKILTCVENNFDMSTVFEYTVEAGRPDTVTAEKLETLKKHSVDRISINPQTFNNQVLENIGRKHTVDDVYKAYEIAQKCGFENINMDLIAGLNGDTVESFMNSIDCAVSLNPSNITVHTLAVKRSSYIVTEDEEIGNSAKNAVKMIDYAWSKLSSSSYEPYYMYRQSKSLGNLENVGWCKKDKECAYNIFMMEECDSVFSCGAGAVTKLKAPRSGCIERIFNFKYPYEYNDKFEELIDRKRRISEFYNEYKIMR